MKSDKRGFKGIWIPKEIWLAENLSTQEKIFLAEIGSLDNEDGCFDSNKYFSSFFELSISRCSSVITQLEKKGYISRKVVYEDDLKTVSSRILKVISYTPLSDLGGGIPGSEGTPLSDLRIPPFGNAKDSNTIYNKEKHNKENNWRKLNKKASK